MWGYVLCVCVFLLSFFTHSSWVKYFKSIYEIKEEELYKMIYNKKLSTSVEGSLGKEFAIVVFVVRDAGHEGRFDLGL